MDTSRIEEVYNKTFAGLALFYRDTNLPQKLVSNYKVGEIIRERGFTDMSYKGGGLVQNTRYLIASNEARDISAVMPHMKDFGMVMLQSDAFFKILDVYQIEGKTQVFLLNIQPGDADFFKSASSSIEEEIIEKARQNFESNVNAVPLPELQSKEWLERTQFPIGMSDEGVLFPLEDKAKMPGTNRNEAKPWWKFW